MSPTALTRTWPALGGWGSGLVQLALGAGMVTGTGAGARALGAVLVASGAGTLAWGVVRLTGDRGTRTGVAVGVAGILAPGAALLVDPVHASVLAVAATVVLSLVVGIGAALGLRRGPGTYAPAGMTGILVGSVLVAALVTPALAATEAGRFATDHGAHSVPAEHTH